MTPRAFQSALTGATGWPETGVLQAETCGLPNIDQAVGDFVQAQRALGASVAEAIGMAAAVHGETAVASLLEAEWAGQKTSYAKLQFLDGVAQAAPVFANATLNTLLATGQCTAWKWADTGLLGLHMDDRSWILSLPDDLWVRGSVYLHNCVSLQSLPDRLRVDGCLSMEGCTALRHLPDGLVVGDSLFLDGCTSLKRLPGDLNVGGRLDLRGCTSWDGRIPEDARIGKEVVTDRHPLGLTLDEWRGRYPQVEG